MTAKAKAKLWVKRMRAFERSGLSRRAWCEQEDVPLSTLDYWRRRLRDAEPTLVPVVVNESPVPARIEVAVGNVHLRLPTSIDATWLNSVLRGLR